MRITWAKKNACYNSKFPESNCHELLDTSVKQSSTIQCKTRNMGEMGMWPPQFNDYPDDSDSFRWQRRERWTSCVFIFSK